MSRSHWIRKPLYSACHAIEQTILHGQQVKKLSVAQIADRAGMASHWTLYKYQENGRLPLVLVRPLEAACGIDLITRYLAHSSNRMLIDIPTGKRSTHQDLHGLQTSFNEAVGLLLKFYDDKNDTKEVLGALTILLESVAWHRKNVESHMQPSFELEMLP